ncbi:hypothetical protein [Dyadobacter luticola]|nr:hypothetical protein [Dyadobacter luticola]
MISLNKEFKNFGDEIRHKFPGSSVKTDTFPSGALSMDIRLENYHLVIDYTKSTGFGVDELKNSVDDAFSPSYKYCYTTFNEAAKKIFEMLNGHYPK